MIQHWLMMKALAVSVGLQEVTQAVPRGHDGLKAFGGRWCYRGRAFGGVFKAGKLRRDVLMQTGAARFFLHPHHAPGDLVLVRAGRMDEDRARRAAQGREVASRRFRVAWDAGNRR